MAVIASFARMETLAFLSSELERVLLRLLPCGSSCALLHFPSSGNVGDNAIWLGTRALLARAGIGVAYSCEIGSYSRERLAARVGKGTILLQGGGNLGDLWPGPEALREEVIRSFPENLIIQLPQTVYFRDKAHISRARAVFNAHSNLHLVLRDRRSYELALNEFRVQCHLCPDMAFALGPLTRSAPPSEKVLCLLRTDKESRGFAAAPDPHRVVQVDWRTEGAGVRALRRVARLAVNRTGTRREASRSDGNRSIGLYDLVARLRLHRGCHILSGGEVVVTDRLHGHILSLMLGIPHVILDNSYGKLRDFYETWTRDCPLVQWADTLDEALEKAALIRGDGAH